MQKLQCGSGVQLLMGNEHNVLLMANEHGIVRWLKVLMAENEFERVLIFFFLQGKREGDEQNQWRHVIERAIVL